MISAGTPVMRRTLRTASYRVKPLSAGRELIAMPSTQTLAAESEQAGTRARRNQTQNATMVMMMTLTLALRAASVFSHISCCRRVFVFSVCGVLAMVMLERLERCLCSLFSFSVCFLFLFSRC